MKLELLSIIANLYNLPKIRFISQVTEGFLSFNFILMHGDTKYFLKQYVTADEARVREIHGVYLFLSKQGIPVIVPIQNKNNTDSFQFQKAQYALFPYVEGIKIARKDLSKDLFKNMGEMLARIHLCGKGYQGARKRQNRFDKEKFYMRLEKVLPLIEADKAKTNFGKLAHSSVVLRKSIIETNPFVKENVDLPNDHLIHGDYHNDNMFFNANSDIEFIFDLDKTEVGPRVFELVRSVMYVCFDSAFEDQNFENARTYLSAYRSLYPISDEEVRKGMIMLFFTKIQSMWIERMHYLDNNVRVDHFLEKEIILLDYLKDNFNIFLKKIK